MKFRKIKLLGSGSFGKVYLIKYPNKKHQYLDNNAFYALKRIHKDDKKSYNNEIQLLSKLDHPNIVNIIKCYENNLYFNIVMMYARCGTLYDLINKRKHKLKIFSNDDIKQLILPIVSGINYLHNNNIIHCDIKPSNILLFGDKIIKISDFGDSKLSLNRYEKTYTYVGTPYYQAPEIINNIGYSFPIDYWALGVIFYELLTLKLPFTGSSLLLLFNNINKCKYNINIINDKYKKIIKGLLEKDMNKRYIYNDIKQFFDNLIILPKI
jgi:serine/threonine protein kinase